MIELKFDFKVFGCNEEHVQALVKEIVRCVNESRMDASGQVVSYMGEPIVSYIAFPPAKQGAWVRPGMVVQRKYSNVNVATNVTVAPKRDHVTTSPCLDYYVDEFLSWDMITNDTHYNFTRNGKPVLGYEEDRPK